MLEEALLKSLAYAPLAALLLTAPALAQTAQPTTPASPANPSPTGSSNPAVNTGGNAPSGVNASGRAQFVAASALENGANSFTEGQAKARLEGAGLTNVADLKKDDQGVWRGTAMRDGKSVKVGFDYKGNISAE
jgi:putative membrane protein